MEHDDEEEEKEEEREAAAAVCESVVWPLPLDTHPQTHSSHRY